MLKIYNDLTKKKEYFKTKDNTVKFYSCGPTIYNYVHIGNLRTFSYEDLLVRLLRFKGFKVIHVRNLTDVDDKIIKALKNTKKSLKEYTDFYANAFFEDTKKLKLSDSDFYPRATSFIDKIVKFIAELSLKGYAYKGEDNSIYFKISKFKDYGKLSGIKLSNLKEGASGRIDSDDYDKENANDFALWKAYVPNDGNVFWETQLGKGRPGWHIECSVMSNTLLGSTLDIHSGGEDLIFPHHENEIAQSEAHNGVQFARFWFHPKHLMVDGKKMSKSLHNFYTLRDIEKKGYNPVAVKLLFFSAHYKNQLNFTFDSLESSEKSLVDLNNTIKLLTNYFSENEIKSNFLDNANNYLKDVVKALEDDLNSPKALYYLYQFDKEVNGLISNGKLTKKETKDLLKIYKKLEDLFGLFNFPEVVNKQISKLAWDRYRFRQDKNFAKSDEIRDKIKDLGFIINDIPNGFVLIKVKK